MLFRMEARAQIKSNLDKDEDDEATDLENNNEFFITEPVSQGTEQKDMSKIHNYFSRIRIFLCFLGICILVDRHQI